MKKLLATNNYEEYVDVISRLKEKRIFYLTAVNSTKSFCMSTPYIFRPGYCFQNDSTKKYQFIIWVRDQHH